MHQATVSRVGLPDSMIAEQLARLNNPTAIKVEGWPARWFASGEANPCEALLREAFGVFGRVDALEVVHASAAAKSNGKGPCSPKSASRSAARTLNAAGPSRVTLSLQ